KSELNTHGFLFVNSDPVMIKFVYLWLTKYLKIQKGLIRPNISINEMHKPRIKKVLKFWAKLLGLPASQFGNPHYVKTVQKKVYENYNSYYGILRLKVRRSAQLRYKVLSLI